MRPSKEAIVEALRKYEGRAPVDFKFDMTATRRTSAEALARYSPSRKLAPRLGGGTVQMSTAPVHEIRAVGDPPLASEAAAAAAPRAMAASSSQSASVIGLSGPGANPSSTNARARRMAS